MNMPARYPERIVCLTEETTETLYLLGEERRIVASPAIRCGRRRRGAKSRGCQRSSRRRPTRSFELRPDLVIGFSDLQADIARELAKAGLNVMLFNQRSIEEILNMICVVVCRRGWRERRSADR